MSSFLANEASPIQDRSQLSTVGLIGDIKELHAKPGPESTGSWTGAGESSTIQFGRLVKLTVVFIVFDHSLEGQTEIHEY